MSYELQGNVDGPFDTYGRIGWGIKLSIKYWVFESNNCCWYAGGSTRYSILRLLVELDGGSYRPHDWHGLFVKEKILSSGWLLKLEPCWNGIGKWERSTPRYTRVDTGIWEWTKLAGGKYEAKFTVSWGVVKGKLEIGSDSDTTGGLML